MSAPIRVHRIGSRVQQQPDALLAAELARVGQQGPVKEGGPGVWVNAAIQQVTEDVTGAHPDGLHRGLGVYRCVDVELACDSDGRLGGIGVRGLGRGIEKIVRIPRLKRGGSQQGCEIVRPAEPGRMMNYELVVGVSGVRIDSGVDQEAAGLGVGLPGGEHEQGDFERPGIGGVRESSVGVGCEGLLDHAAMVIALQFRDKPIDAGLRQGPEEVV